MSGGEYTTFVGDKRFEARVMMAARDARNRYLITFSPSDPTPGLHTIRVRTKEDYGARIVARADYWSEAGSGEQGIERQGPSHPAAEPLGPPVKENAARFPRLRGKAIQEPRPLEQRRDWLCGFRNKLARCHSHGKTSDPREEHADTDQRSDGPLAAPWPAQADHRTENEGDDAIEEKPARA